VAQKVHAIAQPACDEMQSVSRFGVGMRTDSMSSPSASRQRCLAVPSLEREIFSGSSHVSENRSSSAARSAAGRSVIAANEGVRRS
jgi:hypothetical protein